MTAPHRPLRLAWAVACLLGAMLAGCASAQGASPVRAGLPATATPGVVVVPPIHTITLSGYMAAYVWPTAHGFVFTGNPGTTAQQIGPAGAPSLYYYDNATNAVRTVASAAPAADGTTRGIQDITMGGDWVIYLVADSSHSQWELWALNLATGQRTMIDHSPSFFSGSFVSDGTQVVWSALERQGSGTAHVMAVYDLAGGTSHVLQTTADPTALIPRAMAGGALVYEKVVDTSATNGGLNATPDTSLWLWNLDESAPTQVATNSGLTVSATDHYIVWDDVHGRTLSLYDRATGKQSDYFVSACIRPVAAQTRPYLVCVDFDQQSYRLVRLPSGANTTFGAGQAVNGAIAVAGDRAYWVATSNGSTSSNRIAWLEMPQS